MTRYALHALSPHRILDGVDLIAFIGREALAIVIYFAFEVLQFRTFLFSRRRGALTASGGLLRPDVLRCYGK